MQTLDWSKVALRASHGRKQYTLLEGQWDIAHILLVALVCTVH